MCGAGGARCESLLQTSFAMAAPSARMATLTIAPQRAQRGRSTGRLVRSRGASRLSLPGISGPWDAGRPTTALPVAVREVADGRGGDDGDECCCSLQTTSMAAAGRRKAMQQRTAPGGASVPAPSYSAPAYTPPPAPVRTAASPNTRQPRPPPLGHRGQLAVPDCNLHRPRRRVPSGADSALSTLQVGMRPSCHSLGRTPQRSHGLECLPATWGYPCGVLGVLGKAMEMRTLAGLDGPLGFLPSSSRAHSLPHGTSQALPLEFGAKRAWRAACVSTPPLNVVVASTGSRSVDG